MADFYIKIVWLGVHDRFEEGWFTTVLDEALEKIGYVHWTNFYGVQEPSNTDGNQHCVDLIQSGGMDDNNCNAEFPFICKVDLVRID